MNELVQLIKVNLDDQTVIGRELHATLKIKSKYADWIKNMIAYGFIENKDYHTVSKILENGGRTIEHILSLSMAKEICMIQRTPKAKQVREYLIDIEEKWNNPEYVWARAVKMADLKMKQLSGEIMTLNKRIEEMKPKADYCEKILESTNTMLVTQIAQDYGMSAIAFNKTLHELGIQRKVNGQWILYEPYLSKKYTKSHTHSYERTDGSKGSRPNTEWTQEGRKFLYHFLKEHNILPLIEREG